MDRDDAEVTAFCRREHPRLVGALTLYCGNRATAEELAQESLARVWRDWPRVRAMDAPGGYLHRVAMNLATSQLRRRAAERRARARAWSGTRDAYEEPDAADRVAIRQALAGLSPQQRRVLVTRFYLGHDVQGTADLLGLPVGTVKTHTSRGLAALRGALGVDVLAREVADA